MVKKILLGASIAIALASTAFGQSNPGLYTGQVPTAAQWNSFFAAKQDVLGFTPLNKGGDLMLGKLTLSQSTGLRAGLNLQPGSAPGTALDGDIWTTSAGLYAQINGGTVGPFSAATTNPVTFSSPSVVGDLPLFSNTSGATSNLAPSALPFTVTGGSALTTLAQFGTRYMSIRDFTGGVPDWATDITSVLPTATAAALANNVHILMLDGDSRGAGYLINSAYTIPSGILIACPGSPPTRPTNNDYRNFPGGLLLGSTSGISVSSGAGIYGCNPLQKALGQAAPPTDLQSAWARAQSYTGTGITLAGTDAYAGHIMAVGFATALTTKNAREAVAEYLKLDGTTGLNVANQGGGGSIKVHGVEVTSYGTSLQTFSQPHFDGTVGDNGSGELRWTFTTPCTGTNCILDGMTVYGTNVTAASAQSAQGEWTAEHTTSTYTDLAGTTSALFTGGLAEPSVTITAQSPIITGLTLNLQQIHKTQAITGANIPAGATIVAFDPGYGTAWVDYAHMPTASATETVTVADTAPSTFSVSSVSSPPPTPGTSYNAGDIVFLTTGTGSAASFQINSVDPITGAVLTIGFLDGGLYTVAPSISNVPTTGGSGTGLQVNVSLGATLYASANNRAGAAFDFSKVVAVEVSDIDELSHATGIKFGINARGVRVTNANFHDENVLQSQKHFGALFSSTAKDNTLSNCGLYYFGAAIAAHSVASSHVGPNVVSNCELGGSAGNSGLQNTLLNVGSYDASGNPTPGTPMNSSITLSNNYSAVFGTLTVEADVDTVNLCNNNFSNSSLYAASATTNAKVYVCSSDLFASGNSFGGTIPVNQALTSLTAHAGGGQAGATLLSSVTNQVNIVANDHDSAMLLLASPHWSQRIVNHGAHILDIYGMDGDSINGSGSPYQLYPNQSVNFITNTVGTWYGQSGLSTLNGTVCPVGNTCTVGSGAVYNASGTLQTSFHSVQGSYTLSGGQVTITLSGSAIFTGTGTYSCAANDNSGTAATAATQNQSASQFKVFGTGSNSGTYYCIGS